MIKCYLQQPSLKSSTSNIGFRVLHFLKEYVYIAIGNNIRSRSRYYFDARNKGNFLSSVWPSWLLNVSAISMHKNAIKCPFVFGHLFLLLVLERLTSYFFCSRLCLKLDIGSRSSIPRRFENINKQINSLEENFNILV